MKTNLQMIDPIIRKYAGAFHATVASTLKAKYPELSRPYDKKTLINMIKFNTSPLPINKDKILADIEALP
jgi:hypothetical protein